ncbi:uncharacterized protein M421DRAFT_68186 [Didymella exigua CBS 183.55]|uniref:Tat pathway signal sequence n=1 Tax=Didymella exigua CBS 183.55 TaxID=1150837 RepID=A0A6A5RD41_9PLEO|nr:uncharacterized protein M421DRAFT_68186 [Didymella exigua CBS 183.55]KAF1926175.1 hypothetical protein M421DRAFT_68186 [Didymella exigua CBS 183.55]
MDYFRSKRSNAHQPIEDERPSKRISTPAGQRLSMVLESSHIRSKPTKPEPKSKIEVTTTSTYCNDPTHQHIGPTVHVHEQRKPGFLSVITGGRLGETPRGSMEDQSHNGSNLSVSVWSDQHTPRSEKFTQLKAAKNGRRWGWKRVALIGAMVIALIVALAVGLAVGLKRNSSSTSSSKASTGGDSQAAGTGTGTSTETGTPSTPTSTLTPSAVPSGFPVGAYSFVTFLDTVATGCTSNNATWTCAPYTDYYSDPQKALAVINWEITGSFGSYKISSRDSSDLYMTFQNAALDLLDKDKDTERYRFQISRTKTVNMTGTMGNSRGTFECDYGATNLQAYLYTKMARTYPDDTIVVPKTSNTVWPYAVRVEQAVGGGNNVPSCTKSTGEHVSSGIVAQDASSLCSCLYKNWTPERAS